MPYLPTERLKDISWEGSRSSTYKMEDINKAAAIRILEELIGSIKEH